MADVVFVLVALGFFGLCVGYVRALERMVGAAESPDESIDEASRDEVEAVSR